MITVTFTEAEARALALWSLSDLKARFDAFEVASARDKLRAALAAHHEPRQATLDGGSIPASEVPQPEENRP